MLMLNPGEREGPSDGLTPEELQQLERTNTWRKTGLAYALEHGTRPATIGLVVSSNPLALLAW
jgi:microsomal epoxide hydrolase